MREIQYESRNKFNDALAVVPLIMPARRLGRRITCSRVAVSGDGGPQPDQYSPARGLGSQGARL